MGRGGGWGQAGEWHRNGKGSMEAGAMNATPSPSFMPSDLLHGLLRPGPLPAQRTDRRARTQTEQSAESPVCQ